MTPKEKFLSMAEGSKAAIEDFNDFADDRAISWAADALTAEREVSDKLATLLNDALDSFAANLEGGEADEWVMLSRAALAEVAAIRAAHTSGEKA